MSAAAGPGGARRNGLTAASWVALGEYDPRVVRVALAELAEQGIAAYAVPVDGPRGAYLEVHPPAAPAERLHVDAAAAAAARRLVNGLVSGHDHAGATGGVDAGGAEPSVPPPAGPGTEPVTDGPFTTGPAPNGTASGVPAVPGQEAPAGSASGWSADRDTDAEFAAIVAAFHDPGPAGRPWPAAEEVAGAPVRPAYDADPLADEHFERPVAPPVPRPDAITAAAWAGLVGGLGALVGGAVLSHPLSGQPLVLAVGAACAGFVTLVSRRPWHRDDDDNDDGAVI